MENVLVVEKRQELGAKQNQLKELWDQAGPNKDIRLIKGGEFDGLDTTARLDKLTQRALELDSIHKEVEQLLHIDKLAADQLGLEAKLALPGGAGGMVHPTGGDGGQIPGQAQLPGGIKGIGTHFIESKTYTEQGRGMGSRIKEKVFEIAQDVELKTLFQASAGWAPEVLRTGRFVEDAQRPIQIVDIIPSGATDQNAIKYMEETTFTNAAVEANPGASYAESALALTERTSAVEKIATFIPVTDEQLDDVPQVESYLNNRLPFMLMQRLDGQLISGDGSAPNLRGIVNVSGIQTQAKGGDPVPDAIFKAMTKVRVTGRATPSACLLHPNDWQDIRLLRTADGLYIWGNPTEAGPERIWGIPVVVSDALSENTGIVGDFRVHSQLVTRRGVELKVSDSHSTYFVEGKQAIRADMRVAFVVYRPAACATITGI